MSGGCGLENVMPMQWFVIRVQSGREESVREALERRTKAFGLEGRIGRTLIPTEQVSEIKSGQKRVRERKLYPGYVFVETEVGESGDLERDVWYLIRETPGVGDFIGSYRKPVPMQQHEVDKLLGQAEKKEEAPKLKIDFQVGDTVTIKEGAFQNFDGVVEEVIPSKGLVRVTITIFGRATPVELEYWQVEPV